jgi:membrane protein DedA with SNARE-associated domain
MEMHDIIVNLLGNITEIIEQYQYFIIFLFITIESSFIPFPSEIVMIPAGYLIAKGKLSFTFALIASVLGSITGAFINYYLAKKLGVKIINQYGKYFFLSQEKFEKINKFFTHHGAISTFTARLIPGLRQYISIPAGLCSMCKKKFTFYTALGSSIWMAILVIIGMVFGSNELLIKENLSNVTMLTLSIVTIFILSYILMHKKRKLVR